MELKSVNFALPAPPVDISTFTQPSTSCCSTGVFHATADADAPFPRALWRVDRELMGDLFNAISDATPEDPQHLGIVRMANRLYALAQAGKLDEGWMRVILPLRRDETDATVEDWHEAIKTLARDVRRAQAKQLRVKVIPSDVRQALTRSGS